MRSARNFVFAIPLVAILLALGCSGAGRSFEWTGPVGEKFLWKPAQPKIGDLVSVEALLPGARALPDTGLVGADGASIRPLSVDFLPEGLKVRWSFRVTASGDWKWSAGTESQALWSVASVAGQAGELKTLDAQGLWDGTIKSAGSLPDKVSP